MRMISGLPVKPLRVICSIPIKERSERVHGKNFLMVDGVALYQRVIDRAIAARCFAEVVVNTDSWQVADYARASGAIVHAREKRLTGPRANGNDLLCADFDWWEERRRLFHDDESADAWCQLFATAPFLQPATVRRAVGLLEEHPLIDSVFTAVPMRTPFTWLDGQALYDLDGFGRSQDWPHALHRETTGLYLIRTRSLRGLRRRIGRRPLPMVVGQREAMDIDTWCDVERARRAAGEDEEGLEAAEDDPRRDVAEEAAGEVAQ